jgi:hypothetical protein
MRLKEIVECMKKMYKVIRYCVNCGDNGAKDFAGQKRYLRQSCNFNTNLYDIFYK